MPLSKEKWMPEMPMSGVRLQLLPWHGELSTRSLAPAASTAGWFASMAIAGSLEALGRYGVGGLPTDTLLSADVALAGAEIDRVPNVNKSPTTMLTRRTVIRFSFRGDWRRSDWRKGYPFARARKPDRMRF